MSSSYLAKKEEVVHEVTTELRNGMVIQELYPSGRVKRGGRFAKVLGGPFVNKNHRVEVWQHPEVSMFRILSNVELPFDLCKQNFRTATDTYKALAKLSAANMKGAKLVEFPDTETLFAEKPKPEKVKVKNMASPSAAPDVGRIEVYPNWYLSEHYKQDGSAVAFITSSHLDGVLQLEKPSGSRICSFADKEKLLPVLRNSYANFKTAVDHVRAIKMEKNTVWDKSSAK